MAGALFSGVLESAAGAFVFAGAKSVMHEIFGAVLGSFGFLFFAVAGIAARISDQSAALIAAATEAASRGTANAPN